MPHSRPEARPWVVRQVTRLKPDSILDVGVGAGTYWTLLHRKVTARWTGVEIHAPYVPQFGLMDKYDQLIIGDFLRVQVDPHDLVILGDVLEHVERDQAQVMWDKARGLGAVILILPLDDFEQGEVNGNPHEAHLHHWKHEEVLSLGGIIDHWLGPRKGAYLAS